MPFNTSGQKNTNNLSIPRACVFVALLDDNDIPGPFRDVGDVSSAQISFDTTEAEHYTSCGEQRVRDARIAVETNVDLSMTFDHILDTENLELIYAAEAINQTSPPQTGTTTGVFACPNPNYTGNDPLDDQRSITGRHYKFWVEDDTSDYTNIGFAPAGLTVDTSAAPGTSTVAWTPDKNIFGVDASQVEIELSSVANGNDAAGGGTGYTVAAGDFSINATQGTLFIPAGSPLAVAIGTVGTANAADKYVLLRVNYTNPTATAPAQRPVVQGLAKASRAIAIRFEQQDSNRPGFRSVVEIFKTRLIPSGDIDLISDGTDFSTATLEGSVEQPSWMDGTDGLKGFFHKYDVAF